MLLCYGTALQLAEGLRFLFGALALALVAELQNVLTYGFMIPVVSPMAWTMLG
jgi:hypothetical protein